MEGQGNAALQCCGIPHVIREGQQCCWDLGSMQTESKAIFYRWVLEIDPHEACETGGMCCSISTGGRATGESWVRVLVTPFRNCAE